jgi:Zn-dependent peptidase ImmA (M78 family)
MRSLGIRKARQVARALVRRFGVMAPEHVNIEVFAARLGASVIVGPLEGAVAQLVRVGADVHIIVSERVTDPCATRFSIAHELGHFVLDHPSPDPTELCGRRRSRRGDEDARDYEAEANAFAGELLVPFHLVRKQCEVSPVSLEIPWHLAKTFNVSILTATIQFAELSSERCAAVFSANREVQWTARSATFTREIPRGKRLDRDSLAWDFFERGVIDDRAQHVPVDAWLDSSIDVEIVEHSIASAEHATVLSLLWIPESAAVRLGL